MRFETSAAAYRCAQPGAMVLQGSGGGNGVLLWLRYGDSLGAGDYPIRTRGDTTPHGAAAAVRFTIRDYAHGAPLDSGAVSVTRGPAGISARVRGSGLEAGGAQRVRVDASLDAVALSGGDTVTCRLSL